MSEQQERVLVLCIDRDDDIGEKAKIKGPILGKEDVIKAGVALGLADSEDSDLNAVFESVKIFEELKEKYKMEVAVLTGSSNVGLESDTEISSQFSEVLRKFHPDGIVLVSDGSEDEHVLPIIQSKVPIISVRRVIVRQSQQLESMYYKMKDFLHDTLEEPKTSLLFYGIPAVILLMIATLGAESGKIILLGTGIILLFKGLKMEKILFAIGRELKESIIERKLAFFSYVLGGAIGALATIEGYEAFMLLYPSAVFEAIAAFFQATILVYWITGTITWTGRYVSISRRMDKRLITVPMFGFAIALVVWNASMLVIDQNFPLYSFIISVIGGFILIFSALLIEKKEHSKEKRRK